MKFDLPTLISTITAIIGVGGGYWAGYRRSKAEVSQVETSVVSENVKIYQNLLDDLEKRFNERLKAIETEYEEKIVELEKEIGQLRKELASYKRAS